MIEKYMPFIFPVEWKSEVLRKGTRTGTAMQGRYPPSEERGSDTSAHPSTDPPISGSHAASASLLLLARRLEVQQSVHAPTAPPARGEPRRSLAELCADVENRGEASQNSVRM